MKLRIRENVYLRNNVSIENPNSSCAMKVLPYNPKLHFANRRSKKKFPNQIQRFSLLLPAPWLVCVLLFY